MDEVFGAMPRASLEPRRILFVDDDPLILRSIARSMRAAEPTWDVVVCDDAGKALELLEERRTDIVVSDLNMNQVDGAEFLTEVQKRSPEVVRIVLSAMVDARQIIRTVPVAHQFVTKPFEVADLRARLRAALGLSELLRDERLRVLVASDNTLPVVPSTFAELTRLVADPQASIADMARVVEKDTALSAELVRLVSSAYFALPHQIQGMRAAIAYLGVETLKALVLKIEFVREFRPARDLEGFDIEELQAHALEVARSARRLLAGTTLTEEAFSAGILHDVGQLVLASRAPSEFSAAIALAKEKRVSLPDAEREVLGVSHAEIGAYLLGLWGLRQSLTDAVLFHHDPPPAEIGLEVVRAVQQAERDCADSVEDVPGRPPSALFRSHALADGALPPRATGARRLAGHLQ